MEKHDLILNNEPEVLTRPTQNNGTSIIDLTFTTPDIRALDALVIDYDMSTLSDHDLVVCDLTNRDEMVGRMGTSQKMTGCSIRTLSEDDRDEIAAVRLSAMAGRPRV